jgi:hypothetical protein
VERQGDLRALALERHVRHHRREAPCDLAGRPGRRPAPAELDLRFQVPHGGKGGKPDPKKTVLDEPALYAEARRALTEAQPVDPSELQALAQGRAMAVEDSVVASGVVPEMRVFLLEVDEGGPVADGRVRRTCSSAASVGRWSSGVAHRRR